LGPRHIREYHVALFQKRKFGARQRHRPSSSLKVLLHQDAQEKLGIAETPYPKKAHRLPTILSREEVAQILHAARTPSERILLMTLYATGARNAELTPLKVNDIDSQRMVVHIRGGKGRKDLDVMLSPKLLTAPRTHWRFYHRKSQHLAVSEQLSPGSADRYENRLVRLPQSCQARRHRETRPYPPSAPLFRYTSV
jgi:site-specific recombinase XerD